LDCQGKPGNNFGESSPVWDTFIFNTGEKQ